MQEAYKRVLERRRGQIVEQIRWTKEFSTGLEKHGLVSRDELKEIEVCATFHGQATRVLCGSFDTDSK